MSSGTSAGLHPNQTPYYRSPSPLPSPFLAPPIPTTGLAPTPGWTGHHSGPIYAPPNQGPSSIHLQATSHYSPYGQPAYPPSSSHLVPAVHSPSPSPLLHPSYVFPMVGQASLNDSAIQTTTGTPPPASGTSPVPTTSHVQPPPPKKPKRKRKETNTTPAPPAALSGVGPSLPPSAPEVVITAEQPAAPAPVISDLLPTKVARTDTATDIWWFVRKLDKKETPLEAPDDNAARLTERPRGPEAAFIGCRLCVWPAKWTAWKNTNQNASIRDHFMKHHQAEWLETCRLQGLKPSVLSSTPQPVRQGSVPAVARQVLLDRLVEWVVADDQAINVLECPEFRALLKCIGGGSVTDEDIPHRTALTKAILQRHDLEQRKLAIELQAALGRISFTSDLWSNDNLDSFLGLSAHFCQKDSDGHLTLATRLVAFRNIRSSHSGYNMAGVIDKILHKLGISNKVGGFTLDNASNNGTMTRHLKTFLAARGITDFDEEGNRIRCFPHVVNLSVNSFLDNLTNVPSLPASASSNQIMYRQALLRDPVARGKKLVTACRASGHRRTGLRDTIIKGNLDGSFRDVHGQPCQLPVYALCQDCPTRWSSVLILIRRLLILYPAIEKFLLSDGQEDIADFALDRADLLILQDVLQVLMSAHLVQELLSGEKTPTLGIAFPAYELLLENWKQLSTSIPELSHAISAAITKIAEYVAHSRKSHLPTIAMVLNPASKMTWMEKAWSSEEVSEAKQTVINAMLRYRKAMPAPPVPPLRHSRSFSRSLSVPRTLPNSGPNAAPPTAAQSAFLALNRGFERLQSLPTARASERGLAISDSPVGSPVLSRAPSLAPEGPPEVTPEEREQHDRSAITLELQRYLDEPLHPIEVGESILEYWESVENLYPCLYRIALDVLPAQASAVACERVFSSGKETATKRRNRLAPALMEALQHLKFLFRQQRLDFSDEVDPFDGPEYEEPVPLNNSTPSGEDVREALERADVEPGVFTSIADKLASYIPPSSGWSDL